MLINTSTMSSSSLKNNNRSELYVYVTSDFYKSTIYSFESRLSLININCDSANVCSRNKIYGKYVDKSVTYSCNGPNADCRKTKIYCPMNSESECNIYCSFCQNTHIYSKHALIDINLECKNDEISCLGSSIYCDYEIENRQNDNYFVNVIYDDSRSEWIYQSKMCPYHQNLLMKYDHYIDSNDIENESYQLIHGRSFLQYFIAAFLFVLCICCISILFCYFMQHQQNFQQKVEQNMVRHHFANPDLTMDSDFYDDAADDDSNNQNEISYQMEIERMDQEDNGDDVLNLNMNDFDQHPITPTPTPTCEAENI